jgi:hypothetical protein
MDKEEYKERLKEIRTELKDDFKQKLKITGVGIALAGALFLGEVKYVLDYTNNLLKNHYVKELYANENNKKKREQELMKIIGEEKFKKFITTADLMGKISIGTVAASFFYFLMGTGVATGAYLDSRKSLEKELTQTNL